MPQLAVAAAAAFAAASAAVTAISATVVLGLTVGTWVTIGTMALSVGMAFSAAQAAKKAARGLEGAGQQLDLKADANAPVPFVLGRTATGGYLVERYVTGAKNVDLNMVTVLSGGGPIEGIESYLAENTPVTFNFSPSLGLATVTDTVPTSDLYRGKLKMAFLSGSASDGYGLTGLAHARIVASYDSKRFPQGLPKSLWVVRGLKLYDPRQDSTYPGGSGAHRLNDRSTYTYSTNPYIAALNWALGIYADPTRTIRVGGIGGDWEQIDIGSFVAGANIADANAWEVGGVVTTADDKFAVLNTILAAGGGTAVSRGATLSCIVNAPKTTVDVITAADVVGTLEITSSAAWRDRKNKIIPTYREETQNWNMYAGEAVTASTYVTEDDDEERTQEIAYSLVQKASQAAQLAAYDLVNTREFLQFTAVCKPRLLNVRVGDCVTVQLPDVAVGSQKCLVVGRQFDPASMQVSLNLRSETDAKHDFALGRTAVAPPSPALDGYDPSNPAAPSSTAWTITGTSITKDGVTSPALVVEGVQDDPNAAWVNVEFRTFGSSLWTTWATVPAATTKIVVGAVSANTSYEVAVSYTTVRGVVSQRLILGPVTVGKSIAGGVVDGGISWTGNTIINIPPALQVDANGLLSSGSINWGPGVAAADIANSLATVNQFEQQLSNTANAALYAGTSVLTLRSYTDGLVYLNNVPIGTVVLNEATQRVANDAVLTTTIQGVSARLDSNTASLSAAVNNETTARIANGSALATQIAGLTALLAANTATLQAAVNSEIAARANAVTAETTARNTAISQVYTAIGSNTTTVTGLINSEASTRANAVAAETSARNTQVSQINSNAGVIQAAVNAETATRASQANVFAQTFTSLGAYNAGTGVFTLSKTSVNVGTDGTLGTVLSGIKATADGAAANLITETNARISNAGAMSTRLDALNAAISTNASVLQANINAAQTAAVTNTNALAGQYTSLDARLTTANTNLTASISSVQSAQVAANTAISQRVDTLNSTVGGHTSSITNLQTATNGLSAQWVLNVNSTYGVTGMSLASGASGTYFDVFADNFRIRSSTGSVATPFQISGTTITLTGAVQVNGSLVVNGTLQTPSLADYAVTRSISAYYDATSGYGPVLSPAATTYHTLVLPATGAPVDIVAQIDITGFAGSDPDQVPSVGNMTIKRNGTPIKAKAWSILKAMGTIIIHMQDTPLAGSTTYTLEANHNGAVIVNYNSTYFGLRETKK